MPYQDLIIADTGQGSVSRRTFVGSNFVRDININKKGDFFPSVLPRLFGDALFITLLTAVDGVLPFSQAMSVATALTPDCTPLCFAPVALQFPPYYYFIN